MYQTPEQMAALNKTTLETAVRFAGIALESAERFMELQLKATKGMFADGVQQAKAFAEVKDAQDFAQIKNSLQPNLEKTASYVKNVYDVASATQAEINKLVEEHVSDFNKQIVTTLDKMVKTAPAGSEVAVAALKSAISGINASYENMAKSAKQFVDLTQANVEVATSQALNAGKKKSA